jgi:hypothetical protein
MGAAGVTFFNNDNTGAVIYPLLGEEVSGGQDYLPKSIVFKEGPTELAMVSNSKKTVTDNEAKDSARFQKPQAVIHKQAVGIIDPNLLKPLQKRLPMSAKITAVPAQIGGIADDTIKKRLGLNGTFFKKKIANPVIDTEVFI